MMNFDDLASALKGPLRGPGDDSFDDARRVWNARFDRRPDIIARCTDAADVATAVDFARDHGLRLSVKSGGHSYAGTTIADGGLLIDLSGMNSVHVDIDAGTATVGPGVTIGELDAATQAHGLATTGATVSSVGIAGFTLGGGSGYLARAFGLAVDRLLSAEIVTSDGQRIRAAEDENGDLFWAIRGAGANFGIATSLEFRLDRVGSDVLAGQIIYPFRDAGRMLRFFRDFMGEAPDELQVYPFMFKIPPIEAFPEPLHGKPVLDFVLCHLDPGANDVVQPLRELGEAILDSVGPMPYTVAQTGFDANLPNGRRYYSKAHDFAAIGDGVIDSVVEWVPQMRGALSATYFDPSGGAIARVDPQATAFAGRQALYGLHILAGWMDASEDDTVMGWARAFHEALAPHATGGVYVNLLADDESDRVPSAYGENHARLVELKGRWDPQNLFSANHNIAPPG